MQRCDMTLKYEMVIQFNEKLWVKFREKHPSYVDNGKGGYQLVVQEEAKGKAELFDTVGQQQAAPDSLGNADAKNAGKAPAAAAGTDVVEDFDNVDDIIAEIEGLDYGPPDG